MDMSTMDASTSRWGYESNNKILHGWAEAAESKSSKRLVGGRIMYAIGYRAVTPIINPLNHGHLYSIR
jgi:hypothetical protein